MRRKQIFLHVRHAIISSFEFCRKERTHAHKQLGENEEITKKNEPQVFGFHRLSFIRSRKFVERTQIHTQGLRIVSKKKKSPCTLSHTYSEVLRHSSP